MATEVEYPSADGLKCLFSGKPTITKKARFLPGYDAKMKSLLLAIYRGEGSINDIRKDAVPFLQHPEGLCGFRLKGGKLEIIGNFKAAEKKEPKAKTAKPAAKPAPKKVAVKKASKPAPAPVRSDADEPEE